MMRVTDSMRLSTALQSENVTSNQMNTLTGEATSGVRVGKPSDDPAAYSQIVSANSRIAQMTARSSTLTNASDDLNTAAQALSSASDLLAQAKSIALTAANGTDDANSRANAVSQLNSIRDQLVALANTKGTSGYLFGGTQNQSPPFSATGTFSGNAQTTSIEVGDGVTAQSNASGANAFTSAGGMDIFSSLSNLSTALQTNNLAGINTGISDMDTANNQVIKENVHTGALSSRLSSSSQVLQTAMTDAKTSLANVKDADVAQVYSSLSSVQTSYEVAIEVNQQILSTMQARLG